MNINRLKAIVFYVLNEIPRGYVGKHELFKKLHFASQKHLAGYGNVMIAGFYALPHGSLPFKLCDYLKGRNNAIIPSLVIPEKY